MRVPWMTLGMYWPNIPSSCVTARCLNNKHNVFFVAKKLAEIWLYLFLMGEGVRPSLTTPRSTTITRLSFSVRFISTIWKHDCRSTVQLPVCFIIWLKLIRFLTWLLVWCSLSFIKSQSSSFLSCFDCTWSSSAGSFSCYKNAITRENHKRAWRTIKLFRYGLRYETIYLRAIKSWRRAACARYQKN